MDDLKPEKIDRIKLTADIQLHTAALDEPNRIHSDLTPNYTQLHQEMAEFLAAVSQRKIKGLEIPL